MFLGSIKHSNHLIEQSQILGIQIVEFPQNRQVKRPAPVAQTTPTPPSGKRNVQADDFEG